MAARARVFRLVLGAAVIVGSAVCSRGGPGTAPAILQAAIQAHGGAAALASFDRVRIECAGTFKGRVPFVRRVDAVLPDRWAMEVRFMQYGRMQFGVDAKNCWRKERHVVSTCRREEYQRVSQVLNALFLFRFVDPPSLRAAGTVLLDGRRHPVIEAGGVSLVFDPDSRLLSQIRYDGTHVETFSEFQEVNGARVPGRRVLTIRDALDVDERCVFSPGAADEQRLHAPPPSQPGTWFDEVDAARRVAIVETGTLIPDAAALRQVQSDAERWLGPWLSRSDGLILLAPSGPDDVWRVAVTLEPETDAATPPAVRVMTWPEHRYSGLFWSGDNARELLSRGPDLLAYLEQRGLLPAPGASFQIVAPPPDTAGTLWLLRIAVVPRTDSR